MPCNSDYMNPSAAETDSREVAGFIRFVLDFYKKNEIVVPTTLGVTYAEVKEIAKDPYGNPSRLGRMTAALCQLIRKLKKEQRGKLVYDGRNKASRDLASWWDEHKAADRQRKKRERDDKKREATRKVALTKLTFKEREALGVS